MRDLDREPYTADEMKVVEYLKEIIPGIGAGDDPIRFLIASHAAVLTNFDEVKEVAYQTSGILLDMAGMFESKDGQDLLDYLSREPFISNEDFLPWPKTRREVDVFLDNVDHMFLAVERFVDQSIAAVTNHDKGHFIQKARTAFDRVKRAINKKTREKD